MKYEYFKLFMNNIYGAKNTGILCHFALIFESSLLFPQEVEVFVHRRTQYFVLLLK